MDGDKDRVAATVAFLDAVEASEREGNSPEPTPPAGTPAAPEAGGQPAAEQVPAAGEPAAPASEGGQPPAPEAEPSAPATTPTAPSEIVFKVRGAERKFDLTKPEEVAQLRSAAEKGVNYESHMAEFDAKVAERVNQSLASWAYEQGWLVPNPQDPSKPFGDAGKGIEMLVRYLGPDAVRDAASKWVSGAQAPATAGPLAEMMSRHTEFEKHLNPDDDPKDAVLKEAFAATRTLAQQVIDLQKQFNTTVKPLTDWRTQTEQQFQQRQAQDNSAKFKAFADTEILKYEILKGNAKVPGIDDVDRTTIANQARTLYTEARARGENIDPEEAIRRSVKWAAERRTRLFGASASAVRKTQEENRPAPKTAPPATPGKGSPANPAAAQPGPVMTGTPAAVARNLEFLSRWEREHAQS